MIVLIPAYYKMIPMGIPALIDDAQQRLAATDDDAKKTYYQSVIIANTASQG